LLGPGEFSELAPPLHLTCNKLLVYFIVFVEPKLVGIECRLHYVHVGSYALTIGPIVWKHDVIHKTGGT